MINELIEDHKPDVILYGGDDLDRLIQPSNSIFLKTKNNFVELGYPNMAPAIEEQKKLFTQSFHKSISNISIENNDFLKNLDIPFYYVNGNDDISISKDGRRYLKIHNSFYRIGSNHHLITETAKGKVSVKEEDYFHFLGSQIPTLDISTIESGFYVPINPNFGDFEIKTKNETLTAFGFESEYGLKSDIKNRPDGYADIFLSHIPPLGTLDLSVRFGMNHIGSQKLLDVINKYKPKLVICGHSHIWGGISKKIDDTLVINISSQDRDSSIGHYALIDTETWHAEINQIKDKDGFSVRGVSTLKFNLRQKRLHSKEKISSDQINKIGNLIDDLDPWSRKRFNNSKNMHEILDDLDQIGIKTTRVKERIDSFELESPKIKRKITIDPYEHAFVDVETGLAKGLEPGRLWLIGLYYKGDFKQFVYPQEEKDFLKYIVQNQITSLVSWTLYDRNALNPIFEKSKIKIKYIDACQRTSNCVVWHTYRLSELYDALFQNEETNDLIPGHIAGLYADHIIIRKRNCKYCPPRKDLIETIKEKNREDVLKMVKICNKLREY